MTQPIKSSVEASDAPAPIGTYSQGIVHGDTLYISGQIPLVPGGMALVSEDIDDQVRQVFDNLNAIAAAAGTTLDTAIKLTVYLTNLDHFPRVNAVMAEIFTSPFPARAVVEVRALPRAAMIEIDAVVALPRNNN